MLKYRLYWAIRDDALPDASAQLIREGSNVNEKYEYGEIPLFTADKNNHAHLVR